MKKKKILLKILFPVILILALLFTFLGIKTYMAYNVKPLTSEQIDSLKLDNADKLMIVAHPDDDAIWGGGHLAEGNYFILCVTNGNNETRSSEFYKAVEKSGNQGIILSYPDKVNGKRADWENIEENISADINSIISEKDWKLIVTHNEEGEYGHEHHRKLHSIVVSEYEKTSSDARLMFFGKYYKASEIENVSEQLVPLTEKQSEFKEELLECYESQSGVIEKLMHMNEYENWTEYEKSGADYE